MKNALYLLIVLLVISGCKKPSPSYEMREPSQRWTEYRDLSKLWPQLEKEKIKAITFCKEFEVIQTAWEVVQTRGICERDSNDVQSWYVDFNVPKANLAECITLIAKAMTEARRNPAKNPVAPLDKMKIITNKGNYIIPVVSCISNVNASTIYGAEWESCELGEYLKHCGFPIPK